MKKIINLFISLFVIFLLVGCNNTSKSKIKSKEDWDALFNPDNYQNIKLVETSGIPGQDDNDVMEITRDGDKIKIVYRYDSYQAAYYYIRSYDNMSVTSYMEIGSGAFEKDIFSFNSKEEVDDFFNSVMDSIGLVPDYKDYYDKAIYDEDMDCYRFDYGVFDGVEDSIAEIYVKDGVIYKKILYYTILDEERADVNTYINRDEVSVIIPPNKNIVESEDEWRDLFNPNKYKNCSSYITYNDCIYMNNISENIVHKVKFDNDYNTIENKYYLNSNDGTFEAVSIENSDGTYSSTNLYYPYDNMTKFSDHYVLDTYLVDYSDYYEELIAVDDHYEINDGDNLVKIFISNGFIVRIEVSNNEGMLYTIDLSDFGITVIDIVE